MTDDNIRDMKLQYDFNREAAKISTFLSDKIHKYEYLAGEEILPFDQKLIIEQGKFICFFLGKHFEKQAKKIEDQEKNNKKRQLKSMENN